MKTFIAKRKEALHVCDEEALQKYAASAKNICQQSQTEDEPLGEMPSYLWPSMAVLKQSASSGNVLVLFDLLDQGFLMLCEPYPEQPEKVQAVKHILAISSSPAGLLHLHANKHHSNVAEKPSYPSSTPQRPCDCHSLCVQAPPGLYLCKRDTSVKPLPP